MTREAARRAEAVTEAAEAVAEAVPGEGGVERVGRGQLEGAGAIAVARRSDTLFETQHLLADIGRRSARGGALTLGGQAGKFLLQLGSTIVLARLLSPGDYGLVAMVTAVSGFLLIFKDLGLAMATVQRPTITRPQVSTLFWLNLGVSIVLTLVTVGLAPILAWFYGEPRLLPLGMALAGGFVIAGLSVQHQALLQRQMRFSALVAADLASSLAGVVVAVLLAWAGAGAWALVALPLVASAVSTAMQWALTGWVPDRPQRGTGVRRMLRFGGNLTGFTAVNYLSRNMDNVLIGWYWKAAQLGLYSRAYGLMTLPLLQINAPVANVAVPALSRLGGDDDRYRRAYLRLAGLLNLVTMPGIAFMIVTAPWIIAVVLGPHWSGAARPFLWLGIAAIFQPLSNTTGWLFITQDRTRDMFRWGLMAMVLLVSSFAVGLPFGITWVAASYAIAANVVGTPLLLWYVGRKGPVTTGDLCRTLPLAAAVAASTFCGALAVRLAVPDIAPLSGLVVAGAAAAAAGGIALLALPAGRAALRDMRAAVANALAPAPVGARPAEER